MKLLLSLYFFILAVIQAGLFFGIFQYYRSKNLAKPNLYWLFSLLTSMLGLFVFGGGILTVEDLAKTKFNFTIGNTFFYVAAVLQALFCTSINRNVSNRLKIGLSVSTILFIVLFEWLRQYGNFEIRTAFMCVLASIFYSWQIFEVRIKRRVDSSRQLLYLQFASSMELLFALARLGILIFSSLSINKVDQIPQMLILFTVSQLVMNTLSYIAIGGYWTEQIAIANTKSLHENQEIKALLQERDVLIGSLLKANKTASTGALSASIAHELNQPLGASSLNIQFLQKKLAEGDLSPELQKEILDSLLQDNQRAARIIKSLRSIFLQEISIDSKVDVGEIINSVLSITKPETVSRRIQVILSVESKLFAYVNSGEIQQVLLNLINNAIQSLSTSQLPEKKISIEALHHGNSIRVVVADNGFGVSESSKSQLFELLSSTKQSGMGIGLWLCKHIVMRHGGSIWYEDNQGGGAKFILDLPKD